MDGPAQSFRNKVTNSGEGFELSEFTVHLVKLSDTCISETARPKDSCFQGEIRIVLDRRMTFVGNYLGEPSEKGSLGT
jgi:hypothetical protein